ncbi:hypothetical protein HYZ41_00130 [archaeon]|nr:hypothetical protein [archaeon]
MKRMLGQSAVFTHAILLSFTIFLIFIIITTFTTIRGNFQEFVAQNEMNQICFTLRGGFEKIYQQPDYVSPTGTKNTLTIKLPDKLADASYRISFVNRTVKIQVLGPSFNSTCNIGFNTSYSGYAGGGMIEISYSLNTTASVIGMRGL